MKKWICKSKRIHSFTSDMRCTKNPCIVETMFQPGRCLISSVYQEWEEIQEQSRGKKDGQEEMEM